MKEVETGANAVIELATFALLLLAQVITLSQKIYVNEIKTMIQKVHGLHFNACTATTDDITNFSLEKIINTFHGVTPKTWVLVQGLLDANREAWQCTKLPKDTANYQKRHDSDTDLGVNDAVEEGTSESKSKSESGGKNGSSWAKRHNAALLKVVCRQYWLKLTTH